MKITGSKNRTALVVGKVRCAVSVVAGPWVAGVNPEMIKLRAKQFFPSVVREAMNVENGSDMREDYFENDCIRLLPGHVLYEAAKAAI